MAASQVSLAVLILALFRDLESALRWFQGHKNAPNRTGIDMETTDPVVDRLQQLTWTAMAISLSDRQGSGPVPCWLSWIASGKLTGPSPPMSFLRSLPLPHMWPSRGFLYVLLFRRHNTRQSLKPAQPQRSLSFDRVVCYKAFSSGAWTPGAEEGLCGAREKDTL